MPCYFRHLKDILKEAGIEVSPVNRKQIDRAIHDMMGVTYKDCPVAWKKLKQETMADERSRRDFIKKLQNAIH